MQHRTLLTLLAAGFFSGCVVYDNHCPLEGDDHNYGDHDYGDDDAIAATYELSPNVIAPNEVIISSLISDMALDYESIVEVVFTSEEVQVCTTTARDEELLITIGATEFAAEGMVDMIIVFEGGQTETVVGALEITFDTGGPNDSDDGSSGPGNGSNDGSDGGSNDGSDGGSNDGSDGGSNDGSDGGSNDGSDGGSDDSFEDSICG
jgi:hypothetical protein